MPYLKQGSCYAADCDAPAARRQLNGWFCEHHGTVSPTPDPDRTLTALRAAAGIQAETSMLSPWARKGGSDILKERPGGYVSRQRAERIGNGTAKRQTR